MARLWSRPGAARARLRARPGDASQRGAHHFCSVCSACYQHSGCLWHHCSTRRRRFAGDHFGSREIVFACLAVNAARSRGLSQPRFCVCMASAPLESSRRRSGSRDPSTRARRPTTFASRRGHERACISGGRAGGRAAPGPQISKVNLNLRPARQQLQQRPLANSSASA